MAKEIRTEVLSIYQESVHNDFRKALTSSGIELIKTSEGRSTANYDIPEEWEISEPIVLNDQWIQLLGPFVSNVILEGSDEYKDLKECNGKPITAIYFYDWVQYEVK